jgi:hypothetical protein
MLLDRLRRRRTASPLPVRALENAREFCEVAGPWQIAADYHAMPSASLPEIAEVFASQAYSDAKGIRAAAKAGALEGFNRYLAAHPEEPYD